MDSDELIVRVIGGISYKNYWDFGVQLGVNRKDLEFLQDPTVPTHSSHVHNILGAWNRTADPARKTWAHILDALQKAGENTLAKEVRDELFKN